MVAQTSTHRFISLEGIDFTWKTPFSEWLKRDLTAQGKRVLVTRDPPYFISPWKDFYEFFERGDGLSKLAEAHLLLTARLDNSERFIQPALEEGYVVVADRYSDSWLAYQSVRLAHYFGGQQQALEFLISVQDRLSSAGLLAQPRLTAWISEDPEVAIRRASTAAKISKYENLPMQVAVDTQYRALQLRYPDRIKEINVRSLDIHVAYRLVLDAVTRHFDS